MAYIKYKGSKEVMEATILPIRENVVRIITDTEPVLKGFNLFLDKDGKHPMDKGEYESYTTLYRQGDGWYELSNDGNVYVEVAPVQPEEMTEEEKAELEKLQEIDIIQGQISTLKARIEDTDYQIIKTYEYSLVGKEPEYDITFLHEERQQMRDQINELENQLAELVTTE